MRINYQFFVLILTFISISFAAHPNEEILPFSRIKIINDNIYFTLSSTSKDWHKLLSIDSIGADAIIKFSKDKYGESKCDYQIECFKYNIILNFDKIYSQILNKPFSNFIGLESEYDNKTQNGIDVECTHEKYVNNQKTIEDNIKLSKVNSIPEKIFSTSPIDSFIFKGFNKIKRTFNQIFEKGADNDKSNATSKSNLRNELSEIKQSIEKLENEELKIENNLMADMQNINSSITKEKTILENLWKSEIIAGMIGAIFVFSLFVFYYICNGLLQAKIRKRRIIN